MTAHGRFILADRDSPGAHLHIHVVRYKDRVFERDLEELIALTMERRLDGNYVTKGMWSTSPHTLYIPDVDHITEWMKDLDEVGFTEQRPRFLWNRNTYVRTLRTQLGFYFNKVDGDPNGQAASE